MTTALVPVPATGTIDVLCNAFFPDREAVWDAAVAQQCIPLKVRRDPDDAFCDGPTMVARMDETDVATVIIPTGDLHRHGTVVEYDPVAARPEEVAELVEQFPGRFAAWWNVNPQLGMAGVGRARQMVEPTAGSSGCGSTPTRSTVASTTPTTTRTTRSPPSSGFRWPCRPAHRAA